MSKLKHFQISVYQHPASTQSNRIWYGMVDGYTCTTPCETSQKAYEATEAALDNGSFFISLLTTYSAMQNWLKLHPQAQTIGSQSKKEIADKMADLGITIHKVAVHVSRTNAMKKEGIVKDSVLAIINGEWTNKSKGG